MRMTREQFQTWIWSSPIECVLAATTLGRQELRRHCSEQNVPLPPALRDKTDDASQGMQPAAGPWLEVPLHEGARTMLSPEDDGGSLAYSQPGPSVPRGVGPKLQEFLSALELVPAVDGRSVSRRSELTQWLKNQGWSESLANAAARIAFDQGPGGRPRELIR